MRKKKRKRINKRRKNIRKKVKKKIAKARPKKIKGLKINRQINQIKELNSKLKKLNDKIINKQIKRLKRMSLRKSGSFIYQSLNKAYGNIKEKRKIERLKQIKFDRKEKVKQIKKERQERKRIELINKKQVA